MDVEANEPAQTYARSNRLQAFSFEPAVSGSWVNFLFQQVQQASYSSHSEFINANSHKSSTSIEFGANYIPIEDSFVGESLKNKDFLLGFFTTHLGEVTDWLDEYYIDQLVLGGFYGVNLDRTKVNLSHPKAITRVSKYSRDDEMVTYEKSLGSTHFTKDNIDQSRSIVQRVLFRESVIENPLLIKRLYSKAGLRFSEMRL